MAENQIKDVIFLEEDIKVREYSEKLRVLRADGITRINDCKIELASLKKNKLVAEDEKARRISELNSEIEKAKAIESRSRREIAALAKEAVAYVNSISKGIEAAVNEKQNRRMEGAKAFYEKEVSDIQKAYAERIYFGPTNSEVVLEGEVADRVVYGERVDQLVDLDWMYIIENRADWTHRYNQDILEYDGN